MRSRLQEWITQQNESDGKLWRGPFGDQVSFVRDNLTSLFCAGLDYEDCESVPSVLSTHVSKSILLPVYDLRRDDLGLRLVLRGNFYDWKLSVLSERAIEADFSGLFHTTPPVDPQYTGDLLKPVYFEGFPEELVFGYYEPSDRRRWSANIGGKYGLWTTVFLIMRALGAIKPAVWHTKESHRRELDERAARRRAREAHGEEGSS